MTATIRVLAFAGSLRRNSHNRNLIKAAMKLAPATMQIELHDLNAIPLYNADLEPDHVPPAVVEFQRKIKAADALLIASPEYNYSVSGVLKNALDWASRRIGQEVTGLQGKPAAIMGAGGRYGTVRAQMHLRYILLHNDVKVLNKPEVMLVRAGEHFDEDGNLINEESRKLVQELVESLYAWTLLSANIDSQA